MSDFIHDKSIDLLNNLANSLYDRDKNTNCIFFSINEIDLVKNWLSKFSQDIKDNFLLKSRHESRQSKDLTKKKE